jgi:hypothetical protein
VAIIKDVTNGSGTTQFKAVSLGHVVAIIFGLVSLIGAQQTWLWAGAHEREAIVSQLRLQIVSDIERHSVIEERRFAAIERALERIENTDDAQTKQIQINTGKIESGVLKGKP